MIDNKPKILSWQAIVIGAFIGLGLQFLLNLLALSIGLSIFSKKIDGTISFSILNFIGFALVGIISMVTAGWVAGRLTKNSVLQKSWGMLYGLMAWCLTFILTVILITNAIQFSYFHANFTSRQLVAIRITRDLPMITETQSVNNDLDTTSITLNAYVTFALF
ncbi:MAG TPA: hypothetical protein VHA13_03815, partial [Gammaproteobacteria bacterium]|nr:hypothetical protein [Gammaproteobacteria bacterium]